MADNLAITAGTGTTIATDQGASGEHYQKIKLVDGTADSTTVITAGEGVKATALRVTPATDITDATYIGDIKFGESIPAGTNAIGKLAANSGVDIGDVDITSIAAGTNLIGKVSIDQVTANANEVVVKSGTVSTITNVVHVDDNSGTLTVDGTVTANLSATDNAVLDSIQAGTDKIPAQGQALAAASMPVVLPATQITTLTPPAAITNFANETGGNLASIKTNTDKIPSQGQAAMAASVPVTMANNQTDIKITLDSEAVVLGAGTAGIGKLTANDGVDIGNVDVASIAAGDNNIGNVDIASALPAGTNAIGKLAANDGVDIGDVGIQAGTAAIGKLLPPDVDVTTHTNYARKYYTSAGAATDGIIWSPAAGKRWHVAWLYFQISADATITFEDDKSGGDDAVLKGEFKANQGVFLTFPDQYPFSSGEDAADLTVTTTAGNIYVSCGGWEI